MLLPLLLHILLLAVIWLCLVGGLIQQLQRAQYLWKEIIKPRSKSTRFYNPQGKASRSYQAVRGDRRLQKRLLTLLRGDASTAHRLLQHQQRMHPGRSDNWYLEKVIYDLERDRRS